MAQSTATGSRDVAFAGLSVALLAVSAWVTVPIGPVPVTLQVFVEVFVVLALTPRQAGFAAAGYLALGAVGLPVFSGMKGGAAVLAGPTGGFRRGTARPVATDYAVGAAHLVIIYVLVWLQLAAVSGMGLLPALLAGVAPFIAIDVVKIALAVPCARAVRSATHRARA